MSTFQQIVLGYAVLTYAWVIMGTIYESTVEQAEGTGDGEIYAADWYMSAFAPIAVPVIVFVLLATRNRR